MTPLVPLRPDLSDLVGYHSAQVEVEVRLNTNESPFPPPPRWREAFARAVAEIDYHRYPERDAESLCRAVAAHHEVSPEEIFCANGSNEVLQCLLLAYGGPSRRAVTFEPTYALHRHIASLTATPVVSGQRAEDFTLPVSVLEEVVASADPAITFLCSPNNPTGRSEPEEVIRRLVTLAPGLVVVDEAYGQFAPTSVLRLRAEGGEGARRLAVVRTFSKTWALAAVRLGYLVADPEVVQACRQVALPYRLSTTTQTAGLLALQFDAEMRQRVAAVAEERGRVHAGLVALGVTTWPSEANFILFRPEGRPADEVWRALLERSVLVRDCSSWEGLEGCLRVTVGTSEENDRFLEALAGCLP